MSSGFSGPLVFGPEVSNRSYAYRRGTGMVPSAEWSVFMDDFYAWVVGTTITNGPVANTPWGWQGAIIDSGATVTVNSSANIGTTGVLTFADANPSEGAAIYGTRAIQLTSGKRFWMETRVYTNDVSDNTIQFGLSSLTAITNPEDIFTTTTDSLVTVGITDGSARLAMLADKSNTGSTAEVSTTESVVANQFNILALHYDGTRLFGYVNGQLAISWSQAATTIPTGIALSPFLGHINGDGAGGAVVAFDYIRWAAER